jgi:hypothetical protein
VKTIRALQVVGAAAVTAAVFGTALSSSQAATGQGIPPAATAAAVSHPDGSGVALDPPAGHSLVATFLGRGTQVYECIGNADGTSTWRNRPAATLTASRHSRTVLGLHDSRSAQFLAPVPQWTLIADGSRVVGRVAPDGTFPAPDPSTAIAALRLDVIENSGLGELAAVDVVQRDLVQGGVGPAGTCDPASATPVVSPYSARYTFWTPALTVTSSPGAARR